MPFYLEGGGLGFKNSGAVKGGGSINGANGGPLVLFTVFRLHILYMASFNPQYIEHARKCIDWDYFEQDVMRLSGIIRSQNLFPEDPFAQVFQNSYFFNVV